MEEWEAWLSDFIEFTKPVFIMLMGDERPLHATAIRLAKAAGIPVWVLEEGYIRPDFITCEAFGVNANSPISRSPEKYSEAPEAVPEHVRFRKNGFKSMAFFATVYFAAIFFGAVFFPRYRHHRRHSPVAEIYLWIRNVYRKWRFYPLNHRTLLDLLEHHDKHFFVVALQVSDDMQLVAHGRGWTVDRLITATIKSFAVYAKPDDILVFKGHPVDRGHFPHGHLIMEIARLAGCEKRVRFIDDGSIGLMIRHAKGVICINSTSGLSALHHGTPVLTLGEALYDIPGLVAGHGTPHDIDEFWGAPKAPDENMAKNFLASLRRECLLNGTFYSRSGYGLTFNNLRARVAFKPPIALAPPLNIEPLSLPAPALSVNAERSRG